MSAPNRWWSPTPRSVTGLGAAMVLALGACVAPPPGAPAPIVYPSPRRARSQPTAVRGPARDRLLPSGLRIVLDEDPHATAAGVVAVVRGGAGDDPIGAEGLAHLVEHLTYRAVDPPAAGELPLTRWDRLTKSAVAEMNGHTTPDCLIFYELASPRRLQELLRLETARLVNPLAGVDQAAFDLERRIIGSEHLLRDDPRAGGWATNALLPLLFPAPHPYARPTGGTEGSRRGLTLDEARIYAARDFRPARMTLLVTAPPGTISLAAIVDQLPSGLRDAPAVPPPPSEAAKPAAAATAPISQPPPAPAVTSPETGGPLQVERRKSPLSTRELWLAWTLPGSFGELGATEELLAQWLTGDLTSNQFVQEEKRVRKISAWLYPGSVAGVLFVRVLLADEADPDRVAQAVAARVTSLWAREPTSGPIFAEIKNGQETARLLDEPGQLPRVLDLAMQIALAPKAPVPGASQALTGSTVARFGYQELTRARAHAVLFTPAPVAVAEVRVPDGRGHATSAGKPLAEIVPGAANWNVDELRALLPPSPAIAVTKLESGLTVISARRPGAGAVAWLGFRGGYSDADPPLLVELAVRTRPDARQAIGLHPSRPRRHPGRLLRNRRVRSVTAPRRAHIALRQGHDPRQGVAAPRRAETIAGGDRRGRPDRARPPRLLDGDVRGKSLRARGRRRGPGQGHALRHRRLDRARSQPPQRRLDRGRRSRSGRDHAGGGGPLEAVQGADLGGRSARPAGPQDPTAGRPAAAPGDHGAPGRPGRRHARVSLAADDDRQPGQLRPLEERDRGALEHGVAHQPRGRLRRRRHVRTLARRRRLPGRRDLRCR